MNEIIKKQKIVSLSNGINLNLPEDRVEEFLNACEQKKMIKLQGQYVSTKYLVGIFDTEVIEQLRKEKAGKGDWVCDCGNKVPWNKVCGKCNY